MNEVTTEADNSPEALFRAKISDRIRSDIGDLMPDDMLQKLVADAVKGQLYRNASVNTWDTKPWIQKAVDDAVNDRLRVALDDEINAQTEGIKKIVSDVIRERTPDMLAEIIVAGLRGQMHSIEMAVQNVMNRSY